MGLFVIAVLTEAVAPEFTVISTGCVAMVGVASSIRIAASLVAEQAAPLVTVYR